MPKPITVLITVNDHEIRAVLDAFVGSGKQPTLKTRRGVTYYDLGTHGGNRVIQVIARMGSGGPGASLERTRDSIEHWEPVAVIAVGIAFGVDKVKQEIGDVLVSTRMMDYEMVRINPDETWTLRSALPDCGTKLLSRFQTINLGRERGEDWPKNHFGLMLSGQKLVDNFEFRERLKSEFPDAVGGEMEGSGVYTAAHSGQVEWIVVKAICDWAYDKNSVVKDDWQKLAAKNASRVVKVALEAGPMQELEQVRKVTRDPRVRKASKTVSRLVSPSPAKWQMQVQLVTPSDLGADSDQLRALLGQGLRIDDDLIAIAAMECRDHVQLEAPWPTRTRALGELIVVLLWVEVGPKTADEITGPALSLVERACQRSLADGTRVLVCECGRPMPPVPKNAAQLGELMENLTVIGNLRTSMRAAPPPHLRWVEFTEVDQLLHEIHAELREIARQSWPPAEDKAPARSGPRSVPMAKMTLPAEKLEAVQAAYLDWIIAAHDRLELRGIGGVMPFTTIPLEDVYVALRGVKTPAHERHQAHLLHLKEVRQELWEEQQKRPHEYHPEDYFQMILEAQAKAVSKNPQTAGHDAQNTPEISLSLAEAFREERWMVLLGDPGSGKTTLLRWVARNLAKALHPTPCERVIVRAYHVDPAASRSEDKRVDLGPVRLPVLLRISEYSDWLAATKLGESREIIDFLGHHTWPHAPVPIDKEDRNALIEHHLRAGTAVVLLDGMDEVTETSQRGEVMRAIERFIKLWINGRGDAKAAGWPAFTTAPWQHGGNQIVISSRIAGYDVHGIDGPVSHLTVQPMQRQAIEQFCEAWCAAAAALVFPQHQERALKMATEESEGLKKEIFNPKSPQLWEIASNPLMITIIALIYRKRQGHLPAQRSQLYHEALRILVEEWRSSGITADEFITVLAPLAALMHERYSTGYVPEAVLLEEVKRELAALRQPRNPSAKRKLDAEVKSFCMQLKLQVGLLAERATGLYGFLHLTFQEYLAGLWLVRDPATAGQALVNHLTDPRWREPILLALGHISTNEHWGPEAQESVLRQILHADDPLSDLIPRGPLLVVRALPEMHQVSTAMVQEILSRLLRSYTQAAEGQLASVLRSPIEKAVKRLHDSDHRPQVWEGLAQMLQVRKPEDVAPAIACAHLIWANHWSPPPAVARALLALQPHDEGQWSWPVTRLVRGMCGPALQQAEAKAAEAVSAWERRVEDLSEESLIKQLAKAESELSKIEQQLAGEVES